MMILQIDSPVMISVEDSSPQLIETREDIPQVANETDSDGNLMINVNENPSFENWDVNKPADYDSAFASTYRNAVFDYSGPGVTGNYGVLVECEASTTSSATGSVGSNIPSSPVALVEPGISLLLDWNTLQNPVYDYGGAVYIEVQTWDGGSTYRNFFYYLSRSASTTNGSIDAIFILDDTINEWHSFNRNITEDYIAVWGAGDLSSSQYVTLVRLRTYCPTAMDGIVRAAFDNVVLTDGIYSDWIENGDFETGEKSPWDSTEGSTGYLEQSTDSTHETYSVNMSVPVFTAGAGTVQFYRYLDYPWGYFGASPGMMYIDIDWKYNDSSLGGGSQYAFLSLYFRNSTSVYYHYYYFGTQDNILHSENYTTSLTYEMPGFGAKDVWQHSRIDLYEYLSSAGFSNVSLWNIGFYLANWAPGASVSLLVDNFQIITYPLGDPGFEVNEGWYEDPNTPFAGWDDYNGVLTQILKTTDAYQGSYACKLTGTYLNTVGIVRYQDIAVNPSDVTNFAWRIDHIGNENAWAMIRVMFSDGRYFNYLLGAGSSQPFTNASTSRTFYVESFNTTGTWNLLRRNLTADYEASFGPSSNLVIDQIILRMSVGTNDGLTILFDEMHFIDGVSPVIDSVSTLPASPMYYDYVQVNIYAHDDRPGIGEVYVDYYNGTEWTTIPTNDMVTFYAAVIPSYPYGTTISFKVTAVDIGGASIIDDNGGFLYSYVVGDDVNPTLTINEPIDMSDVEGDVPVVALPDDDGGSGIDYVEFRVDTTLFDTDDTFPYVSILDLDSLTLGIHIINVTAYDVAGNSVFDYITINVVDSACPTIDSPEDVVYIEGTSGHWVSWTPDDERPSSYEVFVEGVSTYSGTWNSTSEIINITLDGLNLGEYNYTCVVYDDAGCWTADTIFVTVVDGIPPILDSPVDMEFYAGTTGHILTWNPDDLHPASYRIEVNGVEVLSGLWNSSSEAITFSLDTFTIGVYNVTLIVIDAGSNSVYDSVSVTVLAATTTTTTTTTTTPTTTISNPPYLTMMLIIGGTSISAVAIIIIILMKRSKS